ncbi:hypothetical protein TNCV_1295051 [Trichonephila clavipes]|nr:hypothetical protein TNCV_1295051 [Trichonephila clavipes]
MITTVRRLLLAYVDIHYSTSPLVTNVGVDIRRIRTRDSRIRSHATLPLDNSDLHCLEAVTDLCRYPLRGNQKPSGFLMSDIDFPSLFFVAVFACVLTLSKRPCLSSLPKLSIRGMQTLALQTKTPPESSGASFWRGN